MEIALILAVVALVLALLAAGTPRTQTVSGAGCFPYILLGGLILALIVMGLAGGG